METRARTSHSERTEESASIVVLSPQKQIHRFARDDIVRGFSAACWLSTHNFDGRPSFQQMLGAGSAAALETFVTKIRFLALLGMAASKLSRDTKQVAGG